MPAHHLLPNDVRDALEIAGAAAFVISPALARVVSANGAACHIFGRTAPGAPWVLDSAMPAVGDLRALAQKTAAVCETVPLVFWTAAGSVTHACRVETVSGETGDTLLLVTQQDMPALGSPAIAQQPKPMPVRDDGETLREIARRIREGQTRVVPVVGARPAVEPQEREPPSINAPAKPDATALLTPAAPTFQTNDETEVGTVAQHPSPLDLAKLAHELKSPLSAISAAAEVMRDERFGPIGDARYAGYASGIHDSAHHALAVIDRMLKGAPEFADPRTMRFADFDLNRLVESCASTMGLMAESRGITLTADLSSEAPRVIADETSLRQIVLNLLTNAIKFTPRGGSAVIETRLERNGSQVLIVRDTGPGMTPSQITEAVKPLAAAPPSLRAGGGFGLGLPLVHALAEANGVRLKIDSPPGRGTAVMLTFSKGRLIAV